MVKYKGWIKKKGVKKQPMSKEKVWKSFGKINELFLKPTITFYQKKLQ